MKYLLVVIFQVNVLFPLCQSNSATVEYYKKIIYDQIEKSINYTHLEDASMYYSSEEEINDYGTFDFIVIGAGSTGTVITNRLSEVKNWKILLVEAGNFSNDMVAVPNLAALVQTSSYNWGYTSTPQKTACLNNTDQKCDLPRGRGIGGTTLLNGLMYSRANKKDFDRWAQGGNLGWSFEEIFEYFKKSENFNKNSPNVPVEEDYHGFGGELNVEYAIPGHPLVWSWLQANKEKGYKIIDYNGHNQTGATLVQLNIKSGKRADGGTAFIKPIKNRKNLEISINSYVTKIIIDNRRAVGVEFTKNGKKYFAQTRKEVILSAGAYSSPQILMLSGIGPKNHLQEVEIETISDLPVGSALKDHTAYNGLFFTSNYTEIIEPLETYVEEFLKGAGPMTSYNYAGAAGFYTTKNGQLDYPDIEIGILPLNGFNIVLQELLQKDAAFGNIVASISSPVFMLDTKSVGKIRLKSKCPFDYPLIDLNFLSDGEHHDIDKLYEGIQMALDLMNTSTFAKINATLIKQNVPACDNEVYLSKEYWYCVLPYFTTSGVHPVSSCPMGPDPKKHVVDARAKVYGIEGLRVADASIFPFTLTGHPNAVCVLIGEKVSDMIKDRHLNFV